LSRSSHEASARGVETVSRLASAAAGFGFLVHVMYLNHMDRHAIGSSSLERARIMKLPSGKAYAPLLWVLASAFVAVPFALADAECAQPSSIESPAASAGAIQTDGSAPFTIEMSEENFDRFVRKRDVLREELRAHFRLAERQPYEALISVKHPHGREVLPAARVVLYGFGRTNHGITKCRDAWAYFPEVVEVDTSRCWFEIVPNALIEQFVSLPHLRTIALGNSDSRMDVSSKAIELISSHPKIETLAFGNCRISGDDFAQLADLKTLRSVTLGDRSSPRCFITLAKLPQFRELVLVGGGGRQEDIAFARRIDEETRQAIVSLDGRLTRFAVRGHSFPSIHGSLVRALGEVKSLEMLDLDGALLHEITLADVERLPELVNLRYFVGGVMHYGDHVSAQDRKKADAIVAELTRRVESRRRALEDQRLREAGLLPDK